MFNIILSNTRDTIPLKDIKEVEKVLASIDAGNNIIVCANGIFNPSYLVAILFDSKKLQAEAEMKNLGFKNEKPSPFAKLISGKMEMLPDPCQSSQEKS